MNEMARGPESTFYTFIRMPTSPSGGQGVGMVRAEVNRGELLTSRTEGAYRGEYTAALKVQTN